MAKRNPELGFEKLLDSSSRVMVVNPLNTYWSYQLTSELALRAREFTSNVRWLNVGAKTPLECEINLGDHYSTLKHGRVYRRVARLLSESNISSSNKLLKQKHLKFQTQFKNIDELRTMQFNQIPLGRMIFSAIASSLKSTAFELNDVDRQLNFFMWHAHESFRVISKEIQDYKPNLILTTNDRLIGSAMALGLAKQNNIIGALAYWGHTTDYIEDYAESLYSGREWESKIMEQWNSKREQCTIQAMAKTRNDLENLRKGPSFDSAQYLSSQTKGASLDLNSDYCVFYAQSEHEHSGHLIANPNERFASQYEAFDALQVVCKELGMPLFLKFHPLKTDNRKRDANKKRVDWGSVKLNDTVRIIEESSTLDTYELIMKAKYNVIWSSTVGMECISRGISPIVLGFPLWLNRDWGIHAWDKDSLRRSFMSKSTVIDPRILEPYFFYVNTFGHSCRFSNRISIWNEEGKNVDLWNVYFFAKLREFLRPLKQKIRNNFVK